MEMFKVGGCVRDELLGLKSKDIDFSVVLTDEEIMCVDVMDTAFGPSLTVFGFMQAELMRLGFNVFVSNPEFLTVRAKFPKGHENANLTADFVLARKESDYTDNRRPDRVEPGTLLDDLRRRDFTMNAIAEAADGTLIDPFNGQQDIRDRIIRAVGDPTERFTEDALRIVRALRFSVTKGFGIDGDTQSAIIRRRETVASVSAERVREELVKMFAADPMLTIGTLDSFQMFPIIFDMGINFQPTMKERVR